MELRIEFADWAWARHHNELSWYIRPIILLAFCAAASFRSVIGVTLIGLFFPISAVIFPAPIEPKPYVVEFLESERRLLEAFSALELGLFVCAVVAFLWILAAALWKRSFWLGIIVANLGGIIKLFTSIYLWDKIGKVAILPTIVTAVVFNICAIAAYYLFSGKGTEVS